MGGSNESESTTALVFLWIRLLPQQLSVPWPSLTVKYTYGNIQMWNITFSCVFQILHNCQIYRTLRCWAETKLITYMIALELPRLPQSWWNKALLSTFKWSWVLPYLLGTWLSSWILRPLLYAKHGGSVHKQVLTLVLVHRNLPEPNKDSHLNKLSQRLREFYITKHLKI